MYDAYRYLARTLGLSLTPADPGMTTFSIVLAGELDGYPVRLERHCGRGAHVVVTTPLRIELDLGLRLSRAGMLSAISEWLDLEIRVGDATFDAAFAIRGDEPARVVAMLTPRLRQELTALHVRDFELNDARFSSTFGVSSELASELELAMREAVRVARAVEDARTGTPPASVLRAHHEAWSSFASEHGLHVDSTPSSMHGRLGKVFVSARGLRTGAGEHTLELSVTLDEPLEARLAIEPKRGPIRGLLGEKSVPSGDPRFDATFDVTTTLTDRLPVLLDGEVRQRLLSLQPLGTVTVHDQTAFLRAPAASLEPGRVAEIIEALRSVVETIARNARSPGAAYR